MRCPSVVVLFALSLFAGCEEIQPRYGGVAAGPAAGGASSASADTSWQDAELVKQQARSMSEGLFKDNLDSVLRFTHSKAIEMMGGPKKARQTMVAAYEQLEAANTTIDTFDFPGPPLFRETDQNHYVLIPTRMVMSVNGQKIEGTSFLLGHKPKSGSNWGYISGSEINQGNVRRFFPDFPSDVNFPAVSQKPL